jgi:hypothetical protein
VVSCQSSVVSCQWSVFTLSHWFPDFKKIGVGTGDQGLGASVLSHLIVDNTPSLPRPSPPLGRGWTAAGVLFSRGGPGEGVAAKLLVVTNDAGLHTRDGVVSECSPEFRIQDRPAPKASAPSP